jgi:Icc protein
MSAPARLLQITDTHLLADPAATLLGVDTAATLTAVLDQALAEHLPEAVLATGDLAHDPDDPTAYERFRQLVEARYTGPLLTLPGNHDVGATLQAALPTAGSLRLGPWEVLTFDSHRDGQAEAGFTAGDRRALEVRLQAAAGDHLLLACHHPPLPVGCPWLDKDCIPEGTEMLESCAAAARRPAGAPSRLRALVCGHVHQAFAAAHAGVDVLATPSTCFQFEPGSRRFAIDRGAETGMPGYRWIELGADGRVESCVRRLRGAPLNIDFSGVS